MSIEEAVIETVQSLSTEAQQKVLDYARTLKEAQSKSTAKPKLGKLSEHPAFGMWKDRKDMEDVREWRKQLWNRNR